MPIDEYRVVHELRGRLRVRVPALGRRGFPVDALEYWIESRSGVIEAQANPGAQSLVIRFDPAHADRVALLRRLASFEPSAESRRVARKSGAAEIAPLVRTGMTLLLLPFLPPAAKHVLTFVNVGGTLIKGFETLVQQGVKVEVLDALAVGLAASQGKHYTANITDFLLSAGEYLEQRTERQSDRLLRRLLRPEPVSAWVERAGELIQIPGDAVETGDIVVVGVGETIPVDGRVIDGAALVNQAAVTGEDVPVAKEAPRRVISGSVLVEGRLRIEAVQVGENTTTARVARFIQESLDKGSATERTADALADRRVYLTLGTGALIYGLTRDSTRLQSVFLVDYSCALKLGTPVAFKSGLHQAARHGVLIKGGEAMEQLAVADTMVFDKTGTLTHSELAVTDVVVLTDQVCSEEDLLALVASVEEHASHPVARAVVEAAKDRDLQHISHGEVDYLVAHGLSAQIRIGRITVGSRHYLEEHAGIAFAPYEDRIRRLQDEGKTLLFVGHEKGPVGLIALRDTLRHEAWATLQRLRHLGIEHLVMITGDRRAKAEALGAELGFDAVHAEVHPEEKAALIAALQQTGRKVAFVGDGINDGPALVAADVGIAMPRGADIARATADVVLLDDRLGAIADAREIAAGTLGRIRNNFHAAVGINTGILAGAAFGYLSPVASALLHNGTTLGILLNALSAASPTGWSPMPMRRLARPQETPADP